MKINFLGTSGNKFEIFYEGGKPDYSIWNYYFFSSWCTGTVSAYTSQENIQKLCDGIKFLQKPQSKFQWFSDEGHISIELTSCARGNIKFYFNGLPKMGLDGEIKLNFEIENLMDISLNKISLL